jgi:hypothetical protein
MRHVNKVLAAFAVVAAILLLYACAYLALVVPVLDEIDPSRMMQPQTWAAREAYRFGGEWSERFFWPANEIDRKLRPKTWEFDPFAGMPAGSSS